MTKRTFFLFIFLVWISCPHSSLRAQSENPSQARVAIFYVDGLRPDTIDEMVGENKLPSIKKLFYDQGLRFKNFFTVFPSNTVIANGMLMTGKWPENSGIKTQALFERFRVRPKKFFSHFKKDRFPRYFNLLTETDVAPRILKENKIPTLYNYLGEKYHSGVAPINAVVVPTAWPHVAANVVDKPYMVTIEAADRIDEVNGAYAFRYMTSDPRGRVFLIWFPGMDEEQHRNERGQYGEVRQKIIDIDTWIGKIYEGMVQKNKVPVYAMLFSDHGAIGGKDGVYNQPFYIGRDFFYQDLKINVRGPDFSITHPGTDPKSYAFIDNMGRGQFQIYFPLKDIFSGDWSRPNSFYELEHYGRGPNRQPVNLIEAIADINLESRNRFPGMVNSHPAEFVIVKISKELIYLRNSQGQAALIWMKENEGKPLYRYMPVSWFKQDQDGKNSFEETSGDDPFHYVKVLDAAFLAEYHNDQQWLEATYRTQYPDAVVAIARPFRWNDQLAPFAQAQDPDIVVSAMPGWNFRIEDVNGADHGYLSNDSVRATLMISGPRIKKGELQTPHRMIEVLPTIFELIGFQGKTDFDEQPIREIYEN